MQLVENSGSFTAVGKINHWSVSKEVQHIFGATIGPGYVYSLTTHNGPIIDDLSHRDPDKLWAGARYPAGVANDPRYGGLGAFGVHAFRGDKEGQQSLTVRRDASLYRGCGVIGSRVEASLAPGEDAVHILADVDLALPVVDSDPPTPHEPVLRVTYRWTFHENRAVAIICVRQVWDGSGPPIFWKEPKLGVAFNPPKGAIYKKAALETAKRKLWEQTLSDLPSATKKTRQMRADLRRSVLLSGAKGFPNLRLTAEGWNPVAGKPELWKGSRHGFDAWARRSEKRPRLAKMTKEQLYCCQGENRTLSRNWELCAQEGAIAIGFHAWEGGWGVPDCLVAARLAEPGRAYWTRLEASLIAV